MPGGLCICRFSFALLFSDRTLEARAYAGFILHYCFQTVPWRPLHTQVSFCNHFCFQTAPLRPVHTYNAFKAIMTAQYVADILYIITDSEANLNIIFILFQRQIMEEQQLKKRKPPGIVQGNETNRPSSGTLI